MKKKIILFTVIFIVLTGLGTGLFLYLSNLEDTSFSTGEQQWLESNKNNVVDFYMPSDIAGLTYMGNGVFFDFIDGLSEQTGLTFNAIAYRYGTELEVINYGIEIVADIKENQIAILKDNYVILTADDETYTSLNSLPDIKVGVLASNEEAARKYLNGASIRYEVYETEEELNEAFLGEEPEVNGIIVLRSAYLDRILNNDLQIAYHIRDMTANYVLTINGNDTLNSIIRKYYNSWSDDHLDDSYNTNLLNVYFDFNGVTEREKTTLREKAYIYGFVDNGVYDFTKSGRLNGINQYIIKSFADFANVDVEYLPELKNMDSLVAAFNSGEIDFLFGNNAGEYTTGHVTTAAPIKGEVVILTNVKNNIVISSIHSLTDRTINVVKGTKIERHLQEYGINIKTFDSLGEMLKNTNDNSIIALDLENYEFHKTSSLSSFKINYIFQLEENYNYIINVNNKAFADVFDFYLEYVSVQSVINESYRDLYRENNIVLYLWIAIAVLSLVIIIQAVYHTKKIITFFKKRRGISLSKEDKIRYIDSLTSLKNRLYLNANIEKWDNSEIYPQVIIVIDLNSVAYINDNFGHEEGDKVIAEAANILIQNQMPKSEIMRTDGNEFLIYMVEYDEKQTVAYIRKLNKELSTLTHDFGAAIGYSMINDAIKTIDDAVNEASLDMRTNKEAMLEE